MTQVHTVAAWSAASVQKERFALLIPIQNFVEFPDLKGQHWAIPASVHSPMREEHTSPQKRMRFMSRHSFELFQQGGIDWSGAKLCDELVVVNRMLLSVARYRALYFPGSHYLVVYLRS